MVEGISAIIRLGLVPKPPILEITTQSRIAEWKHLGMQLKLNNVALTC